MIHTSVPLYITTCAIPTHVGSAILDALQRAGELERGKHCEDVATKDTGNCTIKKDAAALHSAATSAICL